MEILDNFLTAIANSIRRKTGKTELIKPSDFASEIESIPQELPFEIQEKNVTLTKGGETIISPDEGYDGMSEVKVNAPLHNKSVTLTSNTSTTIYPDSGNIGMTSVTFNTNIQPTLQAKTQSITGNGTVTVSPDSGYQGLSKVTINTGVYRAITQAGAAASGGDGLKNGRTISIPSGVTSAKIVVSLRHPYSYNFYATCTTNSGTISTSVATDSGNQDNMRNRLYVFNLSKSSSAAATVTIKSVDGSGVGSYQIHYWSVVAIY